MTSCPVGTIVGIALVVIRTKNEEQPVGFSLFVDFPTFVTFGLSLFPSL